MTTTRDTLTNQDKEDLMDFLASYDAERDQLRANPYRPYFGQAAADLLFTDENDTEGQPTQTAFDIQEPPEEGYEPASALVIVLCVFVLIGAAVMALWGFFAYIAPWLAGVVVAWMGR